MPNHRLPALGQLDVTAANPDQPIADRVLPDGETGTAGPPDLHRLPVRPWSKGDPVEQIAGQRCRLHRLSTTPEQFDTGLRMVQNDLLPWARESDGYCGALGVVNRETGEALLLTLWADEESRAKSADAAERLSSIAALASGADLEGVENLDVSLVDLFPNSPVTH